MIHVFLLFCVFLLASLLIDTILYGCRSVVGVYLCSASTRHFAHFLGQIMFSSYVLYLMKGAAACNR